METEFKQIIQSATRAPSGHNTQPWNFLVEGNAIKIFPDYTRRLPIVDPDDHALFISLGCALENLILAAKHFGYHATVDFKASQNEECIKVSLIKEIPNLECDLYFQIDKRQVTRNVYLNKLIPDNEIRQLLEVGKEKDVYIKTLSKKEFGSIIPFIEAASLKQFRNPAFKNELVSWVRFNENTATETSDGLRGASMGSPAVPTFIGKLYFKYLATPETETKKTIDQVSSSSLLLLFLAEINTKEAWINLGRSYQRVALKATSLGIKHAHVNMPCEEAEIRKELKQKLGLGGEPLLLIRMGYSEEMPKSYRREVEKTLIQ
jgi:hypothetical protein